MTPDAEPTPPRIARRRCIRGSCRWWPLHEPQDVSDGPALAVCLACTDVRALQAVLPSKR